MLILSSDVVKTLLLEGLVKVIENNQFKVKNLFKTRCSEELAHVVLESIAGYFTHPDVLTNALVATKAQRVQVALEAF